MLALLLENNPFSVELLTMRLESLGCSVLATGEPDRLVPLAIAHKPDFVVLDLSLGRGDMAAGVDVLFNLRASSVAQIPAIIHSIFVSRPADAPLIAQRAHGILPKPFQFSELRRLVESIRNGTSREGVHPPSVPSRENDAP